MDQTSAEPRPAHPQESQAAPGPDAAYAPGSAETQAGPEGPESGPREGKYQQRSTVAAKAFRGLFWMATTGLGSRIVSLVSTLLLTRYVAPEDYGEVQNTFVVVWMIDLLTQLGLPQYIASRADIGKKQIAHAVFYFHVFGVLGLALCLVLARPLGPVFGTPNMHRYMPGFVAATLFTRVATIPDRLLVRELRFRASSVIRAGAEVAYAVVSLGLAALGKRLDFEAAGIAIAFGGGFAIVWGGIARGLFRVVATAALARTGPWFSFARPDRATTREVLGFGVPITLAGLGSIGAKRWDNLTIASLYGAGASGIYNFAYNLADVPPTVVGEALGDVLAPSFAKVAPDERPRELVRWVGISSLVCFPLGVGLSAVAGSLTWMFNERWMPAVPMLVLLCSLSLTRPAIGTVFSYLQVLGRTRALMVLEWMKAVGVVIAIYGLGRALRAASPELDAKHGPMLACVAIGVVYVANTLAYLIAAARAGGFPARRVIAPMVRPLFACAPMVLAVLGVRYAIGPVGSKPLLALRLVGEIAVGAAAFGLSAWLIARGVSRELLDLAKSAAAKRKGG
jgi:PST family polysaccharide transporter